MKKRPTTCELQTSVFRRLEGRRPNHFGCVCTSMCASWRVGGRWASDLLHGAVVFISSRVWALKVKFMPRQTHTNLLIVMWTYLESEESHLGFFFPIFFYPIWRSTNKQTNRLCLHMWACNILDNLKTLHSPIGLCQRYQHFYFLLFFFWNFWCCGITFSWNIICRLGWVIDLELIRLYWMNWGSLKLKKKIFIFWEKIY